MVLARVCVMGRVMGSKGGCGERDPGEVDQSPGKDFVLYLKSHGQPLMWFQFEAALIKFANFLSAPSSVVGRLEQKAAEEDSWGQRLLP